MRGSFGKRARRKTRDAGSTPVRAGNGSMAEFIPVHGFGALRAVLRTPPSAAPSPLRSVSWDSFRAVKMRLLRHQGALPPLPVPSGKMGCENERLFDARASIGNGSRGLKRRPAQ